MADKNNDRQQSPPNPFLLSSTTTAASTPAFLFNRAPGTGDAGNPSPSTSTTITTTTTVPFGPAATSSTSSPSFLFSRTPGIGDTGSNTSTTSTLVPFGVSSANSFSFIPQLLTTQGDSRASYLRDNSAFNTPTSSPSTLATVTKETATGGGIFGNAQVKTKPYSSLFGGVKRSIDSTSKPLVVKEGELGATEPPHPLLSGTSVSSVFGGSSRTFGPKPPPPPDLEEGEIAEEDEASVSVFGSSGGGGGQGGPVSIFGQVGVPASRTDPFKEARVKEAESTSGVSQRKGVGESSSSVSSGLTSKVNRKSMPSMLNTGSPKSFSTFKAIMEDTVSPSKYKSHKTKDVDKGQSSSPPEYDRKEITKIIVDEIPDNCLDKDFLKAHFSKFGEIKRLVLNAHVHRATVLYNTHHAASKAKRKGCKLHPMVPDVKIYYGTPARRKSKDSTSSDAVQAKKKAIRTLQHAHHTSDLDPYTPLQRPGVEPQPLTPLTPLAAKKFIRAKIARSISKSDKSDSQPSPPTPSRLSVTKKKVRKSSPARERKEPATVTTDETNLEVTLDCVTQNNNDRYMVLKVRDKVLRKERHRTSDLQQASYLAATCPDMCPELERYMRDVQYDLSTTFEMTNGTLDHRLVTKKFSRSSADKDLPLPHELRPGPVLLRTMDFLVCNVISRVEEEGVEVDVWYNYLWNRTRAVRNDLMQQQLTDTDAVAIMERCTRFHIYAAARLCEEPPDLYDDKMNTEHLTKSLQTLKELYHDLGEQGQHFPTEAEFRAYEMLLNLNDGEAIVNKYAQFRDEVQKSSQVQFALKIILAVTFNNYVKFFRLVRESATYLQGCLLHRYFRQVRSRALETIVKSYMPPKVPQSIPLPTLTHILGFESEVESVAYLRTHGIRVSDGAVSLEKNSFIQNPEEMPLPVRPLKLVEVNRNVSVGEVIQGGPIPINPLHTHIPHNSFDEQGSLKPEARDASDQCGAMVRVPLSLAPVVQQPEAMQNYELVSHMKDVYSMVEGLVLPHMLREVAVQVVETARQQVVTQTVASELLAEGVRREVELVAREGYSEVQREEMERRKRQQEEEERRRKAFQELQRIVANVLYTEYSQEFVARYIRKVCEEAVREVSEEVALQELKTELPHMICDEVILSEASVLCEEAIQELTAEQEQKVEAFMKKLALRRIAEHFQVWWLQTQKAQRRKQSQMTFPAACSNLSLRQQSQALGWGYVRDPEHNMSAPQVAELENSNKDALIKLTVKNQLMKECAWHPLPLQQQLATLVDRPSPQHNLLTQYFKVMVCWQEDVDPEVMVWLRSKLRVMEGTRGTDENTDPRTGQVVETLNTTFSFVSRRSGLEYAWVIKEVPVRALDSSHLRGTGLLLFVSGHTRGSACRQRMRELHLRTPGLSFFEINFEGGQEGRMEGWSLVEDDLLKPETSNRLQSLLLEFWRQQSKRVFVTSARLSDLANDMVVQHFLEVVLRKQGERAMDNRSPLSPCSLIELYNSVLETLLLALTDDDLCGLSWPPPELVHLTQTPPLTWNNKDARQASHLLATMKLPPLQLEETVTTWTNLTALVHQYAASVSGPGGDGPVLASHVDSILADARVSLERMLCEDGDEEIFPKLDIHPLLAPWPQIIYACASCKLSGLPSTKVYYQPKRLHFTPPASWVSACRSFESDWEEAIQGSYSCTSRKRKAYREEEEERQNRKVTKARTVQSALLDDIAAERLKCAEFEMNLESSMLDMEEELKLLFDSYY